MLALPFFDWHAKFLLDFWTVDAVHGAERNDAPVRYGVVDEAALDAFKVEVVGVHEVH